MSGTRDDITPGTNTALQAQHGTAYHHCVEIEFGRKVGQKPGAAAGVGHTLVAWKGRGDLPNKLEVYTSVDGGTSWQRVARSGDPIPVSRRRREDGVVEIVPMRAGTAVTNRSVIARLLFNLDAGDPTLGAPIVDEFQIRVTYDDGSFSQTLQTGAALGTGTRLNTGVAQPQNGLVATPDTFLQFGGSRGAALIDSPDIHNGENEKQHLHLSHSGGTYSIPQGATFEAQYDHPNRRAEASMAIEGYFYAEKTTGVIVGSTTRQYYQEGWGCIVDLVQTDDESSFVRFRAQDRALAPSDEVRGHYLESPAGSVKLRRWYHVGFSFDGFWGILTLDGVVVSRRVMDAALQFILRNGVRVPLGMVIATDGRWVFGRHPIEQFNVGSTARSFSGRLSEWRFYAKAIGVGAFQQRMRRRPSAPEVAVMVEKDALRAYWPMNDGAGELVTDASGNGHHLRFDQQQVGPATEAPQPMQVGWKQDNRQVWAGFPTGRREVAPSVFEFDERVPGRQTPPFDIDVPGEVLRFTDAPMPVTFPDDREFVAVGRAGGIQAIQETGDLVPTGLKLTLSGIPPQHLSIALGLPYLDRPCRAYQVTWGGDGTQYDPYQIFDGALDRLDPEVGPEIPGVGMPAVIRASAESPLRNWRRPKLRRWNDEGQRRIWPDDHGLGFLADEVIKDEWWPTRVLATGGDDEG